MMRLMLLGLVAVMLAPARGSADELIKLLDNTRIVGKLLHYYDGIATVQLPNKTKMRLPLAKIREIRFKLPKPRAALSSPSKSFKRLRKAAMRGDLETYVDSHSTYYQMLLNHQVQMATPRKFIKRLKAEWGNVKLEVLGTKVKGAVAVMKVRRRKEGQSQDGELRFIKENNEWKMILPL